MSQPSLTNESFSISIGGREEELISNLRNPCEDDRSETLNVFQSKMERISIIKDASSYEFNELSSFLNSMTATGNENTRNEMDHNNENCLHTDADIKNYRSLEGLISNEENLDVEKFHSLMDPKKEYLQMKKSPSDISAFSADISCASTVAVGNRKIDSVNATTLAVRSHHCVVDEESFEIQSFVLDLDSNKENINPTDKLVSQPLNEIQNISDDDKDKKSENFSPLKARKLFTRPISKAFSTSTIGKKNEMDKKQRNRLLAWSTRSLLKRSNSRREPKQYRRYDDTSYAGHEESVSDSDKLQNPNNEKPPVPVQKPIDNHDEDNNQNLKEKGEKPKTVIKVTKDEPGGFSCSMLYGNDLEDFEDYRDDESEIENFINKNQLTELDHVSTNKLCFFCG